MFALINTDNHNIISRHRTIENAVKADHKLQKTIKQINGQSAYLGTAIVSLRSDGEFEWLVGDEYKDQIAIARESLRFVAR